MSRVLCAVLALAFTVGAGALALPVPAQPPPVRWELYIKPNSYPLYSLFFSPGYAGNGSADTLYVIGNEGIWKVRPDGAYTNLIDWGCEYIVQVTERVLVTGSRAGPCGNGFRSTDGGKTWDRTDLAREGVVALFQSTLPALGGRTFMGDAPTVRFSFGQGAPGTWSPQVEVGGEPSVFGEVPPSPAYPNGRLLAGIKFGGTLLSDDGGVTFTPAVGFSRPGFWPQSFTLAPDASSPYGGTLYASMADFSAGDRAAVLASDDGGSTWEIRHQFAPGELGLREITDAVVVWGPDGVLYGGLTQTNGPNDLGTMARSLNGGRTWELMAEGYTGGGVAGMVLGRDGRLYAASRHGVWRTAEALSVAGEAAPEASERLGVAVRPNPAGGRVEVVLRTADAGTARVVVTDALGREVAVVLDGAVSAGRRFGRSRRRRCPPACTSCAPRRGARRRRRASSWLGSVRCGLRWVLSDGPRRGGARRQPGGGATPQAAAGARSERLGAASSREPVGAPALVSETPPGCQGSLPPGGGRAAKF